MTRHGRRMLAALILVWVVALLGALPTSAHALLVSSNPQPRQWLGTGPGVVVLEFSERLNPRLSAASVTDPTGRAWPGGVSGSQELRIPVQTNAQGTYTVAWTSVSLTDGHRISESFSFGVGVSLATSSASSEAAGNPQPTDVLLGVAKWVEALALLALVGQLLVARLALRAPRLAWVKPQLVLAPIALSAGLIVVWAEAIAASGGHSASTFAAFFTSSPSGVARLVRLGFEVLAVAAFVRRSGSIWLWTLGSLVALSASGHAANVQPAWWGIGIDSVHLIAGGLWAGGIIGLATQRPPGGWRSPDARQLLIRFSPVALSAFVVTVAGGGIEAALQLGTFEALFGTVYGRVLLAKMALVGFMLPLSFVAWRLRRPRPRIEAAIAGCVVAAAALLASFPLPPTEAADQLARQQSTLSAQGTPQAGDITFGGHAGSVLVALSLEPGRPGPNRVAVYLVPIEGSSAAAALLANATVGTTSLPLRNCGDSCREATFNLLGGETLDVDVLNPGGGRATFTIPPLPAPDGKAELALMQQQMHRLTSYHVAETLSAGRSVVSSDYASVAPDRSVWAVSGVTNNVWIGSTQYTRAGADQPWQVNTGVPSNKVPSFVWDYFEPLTNARLVGHDTIDGAPTTVVAAFGNRSGTPLWFRFWIDVTGRVLQVDMDAPGHFMTDRYISFDAPLQILAPATTPSAASPSPSVAS